MKPKHFYYTIFILLILSSCSKIEKNDLVGTYVANHHYGTDSLFVKENNTYELKLKLKLNKRKNIVRVGEWDFNDNYISFDNFSFFLPEHDYPEKPGVWMVEPERMFGKLKLVIDSDLGFYYYKQKDK